MKAASKVFYTIGRIFNVITIIVAALFIVFGVILFTMADQIYAQLAEESVEGIGASGDIKLIGIFLMAAAAVSLLVTVVVFILACNASRKLDNDTQENGPHIVMIVIGIFGDVFYLLGGIFGLIEEGEHPKK